MSAAVAVLQKLREVRKKLTKRIWPRFETIAGLCVGL